MPLLQANLSSTTPVFYHVSYVCSGINCSTGIDHQLKAFGPLFCYLNLINFIIFLQKIYLTFKDNGINDWIYFIVLKVVITN